MAPTAAAPLGAATGEQLRCSYTLLILRFEWDEAKNRENKHKHGVSLEEAQTIFFDDWAVLIEDDEDGEDEEERFVLIGTSAAMRVLVVSHT